METMSGLCMDSRVRLVYEPPIGAYGWSRNAIDGCLAVAAGNPNLREGAYVRRMSPMEVILLSETQAKTENSFGTSHPVLNFEPNELRRRRISRRILNHVGR
jgi:hypothetical protein